MREVCFLIVMLLYSMHISAQGQTFEARIIDADTGEPMPCVGVYIKEGRTTLSNFDGDFIIKADSSEVVRLTCIGYRTLYFTFAKLPPIVKMEPLAGTMSEVTVKGLEHQLLQISRRMEKDFRNKRTKTSQYFYRQTTVISRKQDIVEAFIRARSACNLRNLQFLNGRHGIATKEQWEKSIFANMNMHHVLELGAMTRDVLFWNSLITPLQSQGEQYIIRANRKADRLAAMERYQKYYDIDIRDITDEGRHILRIEMQRREDVDDKLPIMTGILYVDAGTLQTLAFDGKIENMELQFRPTQLESIINIPVSLNLHIDYRHDHGFAEVADIGMQIRFENFQTRAMLFNVDDNQLKSLSSTRIGENMLSSIEKVGFDSVFWDKNEIIKRTIEEERIAEGFIGEEEAKIDSAITDLNMRPPLERLVERARLFGERIPQEKVYVQLDNTCYFLGDTIWFSAFTRRTNSGRPSRISRVLYAELWNHDGYLVERKLVEMRDGRGSGFFELPDTLYSGYFELRAYTRWQLNWGQTEHPHNKYTERQFYNESMARDFFRDYEKLYSRVFPVYDKPKEEGVFRRDMTLRPLRRYFRKEPDKPRLMLSLFPEGGNAVYGMPCRVAFEAAMQDGEAREGELRLLCGDSLVASVHTEHRGRGSFAFTPQSGKKYKAHFIADAGDLTAKEELKDMEKEGVSLQVVREDTLWNFIVQSNLSRPLGMTVMHEGVVQRVDTLYNGILTIGNGKLPAGVNQVTVFDEDGRVWADRLFFVTKEELTRQTLDISGVKEQYEPYEQAGIDVKCIMPDAEAPASISIAVRDAALQDRTYDTGNIMTEMLLSSEIKGFVPQPEWYFEQDDEEHRRALDLLMMTQGWRRFRWRDMAVKGEWEVTHPAEQTQILTGSVNKYYQPYIESEADGGEFAKWLEIHDKELENIMKRAESEQKDGFISERFSRAHEDIRLALEQKEEEKSQKTEYRFESGGNSRFGNIKREVRVHAEFVHMGNSKDGITGEVTTRNGLFRMDIPRFYGQCVFFLGAQDTTKWKKNKPHKEWIKLDDDEFKRFREDAEFYVRLNFPYPRWVKPYTYYQVNEASFADSLHLGAPFDNKVLNEVTVRARRNGRHQLDLSKPIYVVDAYEAANAAMDAGLTTDIYYTFTPDNPYIILKDGDGYPQSQLTQAIAENYISDMGMYREYPLATFLDSIRVAGDGVYTTPFISPGEFRRYNRLEYIDKVYIYSDYSPRMEGSKRYSQDDQPSVEVSLHKYPNNERRVTYRDRRYILPGFAYQEDFYHPDYHRNPPAEGHKDYRRTLYWNPNLPLDNEGRARITFFTGTRPAQISIEANGISSNGSLLHN